MEILYLLIQIIFGPFFLIYSISALITPLCLKRPRSFVIYSIITFIYGAFYIYWGNHALNDSTASGMQAALGALIFVSASCLTIHAIIGMVAKWKVLKLEGKVGNLIFYRSPLFVWPFIVPSYFFSKVACGLVVLYFIGTLVLNQKPKQTSEHASTNTVA